MARLLFIIGFCVTASWYAVPSGAADAATTYANRCAFCHGATGKGDGPAGVALKPPPRDLTTPEYWQSASPETMRAVIANGKPGTAMVAFKDMLSAEEIDALVEYIKTFKPHS